MTDPTSTSRTHVNVDTGRPTLVMTTRPALGECPECSRTVSASAAQCPRCGAPLGENRAQLIAAGAYLGPRRPLPLPFWLAVVALLLFLGAAVWVSWGALVVVTPYLVLDAMLRSRLQLGPAWVRRPVVFLFAILYLAFSCYLIEGVLGIH